MSKTSTKVSSPKIDFTFDKNLERQIQKIVDEDIKGAMKAGLSPVRGKGRFVAYKDKESYPGDKKGSRPVNLKLTGELYDAINAKLKNAQEIEIGVYGDADLLAKAKGNNEGTKHVPERRFIPLRAERFNVTIETKIKEAVMKWLETKFRS